MKGLSRRSRLAKADCPILARTIGLPTVAAQRRRRVAAAVLVAVLSGAAVSTGVRSPAEAFGVG